MGATWFILDKDYTLLIILLYSKCNVLVEYDVWKWRLPLENIWHAKDDNTGDDVEEITEGQDTHELMESVFLAAEPEDEADIANNTENTNNYLNMMSIHYFLF